MAGKINNKELDIQVTKENIEHTQITTIQKQLTKERHKRMTIMTLLLSALIFTIVFGTLENPYQYTFSKIGNRFTFENRVLFIVWASYTGFVIQFSILALFALEKYKRKLPYTFIAISAVFLVLSSIAPSLDHLPFWTSVHLLTAEMFGLFLTLGFYPFIIWVARENPRLKRNVSIWLMIVWGGAFILMFIFGNTGIFEMWFFILFIIFLLYLSLNLFEEQIVKQSIMLLKDSDNLNTGIEKIFRKNEAYKSKNKKKQTNKKSN
jgi:hypothetical protein